jgi:DNA-binding NarL/FixJ family response regulator
MINILLVNETRLMCNVLASALEDAEDIQVIGCTTTVEEAFGKIKLDGVDVVLASTRLPDQGTFKLLELIREEEPSIDLVVIGVTETKERILQYVEAGASGFVAKNSTLEEMLKAIRLAHQGKAIIPPSITAALMERLAEYAEIFSDLEMGVIDSAGLTDRELEVLELLGKNKTNSEIAEELFIEVGTVKNHVHSILNKLNVSSRSEAATYLALIRR